MGQALETDDQTAFERQLQVAENLLTVDGGEPLGYGNAAEAATPPAVTLQQADEGHALTQRQSATPTRQSRHWGNRSRVTRRDNAVTQPESSHSMQSSVDSHEELNREPPVSLHHLAERSPSTLFALSMTESYIGRVSTYFALFLGSGLTLQWSKDFMPVLAPLVKATSWFLFPIPVGVALTLLGLYARRQNKPLLRERVDCASNGYILSLAAFWVLFFKQG